MKRNPKLTRSILVLGVLCASLFLPVSTAFGGPPVQVNEADPSSAERGTVNLDVTITGKNFEVSAVARFFVTGTTNPGGVVVNSTAFVSSKKLVANIDVGDLAELDLFDIEVEMLSNGRKGKGTEKFAVVEKGGGPAEEIPVCATFRNAVGDLIRSDALSDTYCHDAEPRLHVLIGPHQGRFNIWTDKTSREAVLQFPDCGNFIADATCSTVVAFGTLNEWVDNGLGGLESTGEKLDLRAMDYPNGLAYVDFQAAFPSESKSTPHLIVFGGSNHDHCGDPLPVTRLDEDNWVIEATTEKGCLVEIIKKGNRRVVHHPGWVLPLRITMTRQ